MGGYHADVGDARPEGASWRSRTSASRSPRRSSRRSRPGRSRTWRRCARRSRRGARADVDPGPRPQEGHGRSTRSWASRPVDELVDAIEDGRARRAQGVRREDRRRTSCEGLQQLSDSGGRVLVDVALDVAEELLDRAARAGQVRRAAYAGSLRRMRETIGDVDLLVASDSARADHGGVRRAAARRRG